MAEIARKTKRYPTDLQFPIEAGRVFRRETGQRSDLKPATIPN